MKIKRIVAYILIIAVLVALLFSYFYYKPSIQYEESEATPEATSTEAITWDVSPTPSSSEIGCCEYPEVNSCVDDVTEGECYNLETWANFLKNGKCDSENHCIEKPWCSEENEIICDTLARGKACCNSLFQRCSVDFNLGIPYDSCEWCCQLRVFHGIPGTTVGYFTNEESMPCIGGMVLNCESTYVPLPNRCVWVCVRPEPSPSPSTIT